jgi:acetylornithine deacetylase/succinyl-diaminopimelate desuccinylase-like protein
MPSDWQAYLDEHEKQALDDLRAFLRIDSVSTDPAYADRCREAASWVLDRLERVGFEGDTVTVDGGHPLVDAELVVDEDAPTVTIYGHYDVQPPGDEDAWTTPAFEPTVVEDDEKGTILRARGATDNKGQLMANLQGVTAHAEAGTLPVNVRVLVEGEEETGGDSLPTYIRDNEDELDSDAVLVSDTHLWDADHPAVVHGLRGVVTLEATARGPDRDLHSGQFGGSVLNPAEAMARALASLKNEDLRVAVDGFYDNVRELDDAQRELMEQVPFDAEAFRQETGAPALDGEAGYEPLERMWARPSLEVNGLASGYAGEGFKTILPAEATLKLSCRIVADQTPDRVGRLLAEHLEDQTPDTVDLDAEVLQTNPAWYVDPHNDVIETAADALEDAFGGEAVFIRNGASIPVVPVLQRLAPVALMGYGMRDERLHAPDEFFRVDHFRRGARAMGHALDRLGDVLG